METDNEYGNRGIKEWNKYARDVDRELPLASDLRSGDVCFLLLL